MSVLKLQDVSYYYTQGEPVLAHVNLTLGNGAVALVGQNGAGKTTLVKLIKGLLQPVSGEILLNGESIRGRTAASLAGEIGFVFQNPGDQIFKSRVLDEVAFGPANLGLSWDEACLRARDALETVGLSGFDAVNPYDMSFCQRKLITIASILAMQTPVIIFDEPTIAQDHGGREVIRRVIQSLRDSGRLALAILHDMDFVAECFERVIVLAEGELLMDGPPAQVFAQDGILRRAHLEPPHVARLCRAIGMRRLCLTADEFIQYAT